MADARAREQLRQERVAFERACRHVEAWFRLRLVMGYLALIIISVILGAAIWVLVHPAAYGPLPLGAAAIALTTQALGISFGIVRLVLSQPASHRLMPATSNTVAKAEAAAVPAIGVPTAPRCQRGR